jgi:hypothetical protein
LQAKQAAIQPGTSEAGITPVAAAVT